MKRMLGAVLGFAVLCGASAVTAETIGIPGSGSSQSLLRDLAAAFEKTTPGVKIDIPDSVGTGGGMKAAGEGKAVIARVGRKPNDKEAAYGLVFLPFARQPVVFATHPSVKIKGLTRAQSRDLFSGKIVSWQDVGGPDLKVRIISRPTSETNFKLLQQSIPEWKDLVVTERSKSAATDQEMVQFIAEHEGAIGFNVISEVLEKGLSPLALDGVAAGADAYPVLVDAGFVFKPGALTGNLKAFVDFIFSAAGAKIIRANHAVPTGRAQ